MEGDQMKMREALELALDALISWLNGTIDRATNRETIKAIRAALAAPPRNCDVGTPEEQYRRWVHFCEQRLHRCDNCPCNRPEGCTFTFENMPYDAQEGAEK